jgi:hypothetical protein
MTPLGAFVFGIAGMWILDGAACHLLPRLLREAYAARAAQDDARMGRRGSWLIAGGAVGMVVAVLVL